MQHIGFSFEIVVDWFMLLFAVGLTLHIIFGFDWHSL